MTNPAYDVIVVGARCAGGTTAMLLARKGYRVLAVDRAAFPSDTISTHLIHPTGVAALRRWGLAERVIASGCPPIDTYAFDFGPFTLAGAPGTQQEPFAYAPRRTVLDKILVDAARESGVEVREEFVVEKLLWREDRVCGIQGHAKGGDSVTEEARCVIGADGLHSLVAQAVGPDQYDEKPPLLAGYYTYWSGLPMHGRFESYVLPGRGLAAWPTNDDLTLVIAGWPMAEFEENRSDIEGNYRSVLEMAPSFAERARRATQVDRFYGMPVPNYFRRPFGPGWVLVGDAGYNKDFITAMGISDAFRDAELCTTALDEAMSGTRDFGDAMHNYQMRRDEEVVPMYHFTLQLASLQPPPPELQRVLMAAHGNQEAMDAFAQMNGGVLSPADFFSEENVGRILAAATHA